MYINHDDLLKRMKRKQQKNSAKMFPGKSVEQGRGIQEMQTWLRGGQQKPNFPYQVLKRILGRESPEHDEEKIQQEQVLARAPGPLRAS